MQKIIFLALALTLTCAFSSPAYCTFFKSFGESFSGASCSTDLDTGCNSVMDGFEQLMKVLGGDTSAFTILIADAMRVYSSAISSVNSCEYLERFHNLVENVFKVYIIVMQHFNELREDAQCIIQAYITMDCAKLGGCVGDILKILTTKA